MPRKRRQLPWLAERGGVYYAHWYDDARRRTDRLSLRTADPTEAAQRFASFLTQGADVYTAGERHARLTVAQALDDYFREHVVVNCLPSETTISHDISRLKEHLGSLAVADLDIPTCRGYANARRLAGLADATIRKEMTPLASAIAHAVKWKRIGPNDAPFIEKPLPGPSRLRWLTFDELARLRAAAMGRTAVFVELAYYTAARRRMIERMKWFQVDFRARTINLAWPGERVPKNKRRPVVPIDPDLLPYLQRLFAEKTSEYVLGRPGDARQSFDAAAKRAGLEGVSPHTMRHTRATHLLQAGVSIWHVAGLLGDTVQTVEKVYGHHSPHHLEAALKGRNDA